MKIWSPNSLVLHAPPAEDEGQVAVVFRHQHPKFSKGDFKRMVGTPGLMPTSHVLYTYLDDGKPVPPSCPNVDRFQRD